MSTASKNKLFFPFFGNSIGGSHLATLKLIPWLSSRYDITIILHQRGPLSQLLDSKNIEYHLLTYPLCSWFIDGRLGQLISILYHAVFVRNYVRKSQAAIVHTNDARMHLIWGAASLTHDTVHVWHQHSLFPESRITEFLVRKAQAIFAVSNYIAAKSSDAIRYRIRVSGNPLTLDFQHGNLSKRSERVALGKKVITVASVSNLRPVKRPEFLARIVAELSELLRCRVRLLHLGRVEAGSAEVMQQVWRETGALVDFETPGFVENVAGELSQADIMVAAAKTEGFGLTLLEAMAVGVPVFACAGGGHLEIVSNGRNGYIIDADDPVTAARQIFSALSNPREVQQCVQRGCETVQSYHPKECAERLCKCYEELLREV